MYKNILRKRCFRLVYIIGLFHTTLEEFENGGSSLQNAASVFLPRYAGRSHLYSYFRKITYYILWRHRVFKIFAVHTKTQSQRLKFLQFEEYFRKAPFSRRISVEVRLNRRNKAGFSNSSGVLSVDRRCLTLYVHFRRDLQAEKSLSFPVPF